LLEELGASEEGGVVRLTLNGKEIVLGGCEESNCVVFIDDDADLPCICKLGSRRHNCGGALLEAYPYLEDCGDGCISLMLVPKALGMRLVPELSPRPLALLALAVSVGAFAFQELLKRRN